jgi:hypothetical protein
LKPLPQGLISFGASLNQVTIRKPGLQRTDGNLASRPHRLANQSKATRATKTKLTASTLAAPVPAKRRC